MMNNFDANLHVFHSPKFQSVVDDAIKFFVETPVHLLPPPSRFIGSGVYGLYYIGRYGLYAKIANLNRDTCVQPIYVGKAVPPGWRTARVKDSETPDLCQRLQEHAEAYNKEPIYKVMISDVGS